jgi:4-phytase/acid phosphatase
MRMRKLLGLSIGTLLLTCAAASASSIDISTTGRFSSSDASAGSLVAPGAVWSLNFIASSTLVISNGSATSFDIAFSSFRYTLNGISVAATPSSIRLYDTPDGGLFTLFFGPETGFTTSGQPIPEFSFEGAQLFIGSLTSPTLLTGSFSVSDWTYSDTVNFDDHPSGDSPVLATTVPEPASLAFAGLALLVLGVFSLRRKAPAAVVMSAAVLLTNHLAEAQTVDNTTLKFALVFSRHGVRPPTKTNDAYQPYAVSTWPSWSVPVGNLTTHGAQLMTLMGNYYYSYFQQQGLLSGDQRKDVRKVYYYADNAERTYATAQALAAGMFPLVATQVNEYTPTTASDPLFYPVKVNLGSPDVNLAAAALNGRIGSNPSQLQTAQTLQFQLLESALLNQPIETDPTLAPSGLTSVAAQPLTVTPGSGGSIVGFSGGIDTASTLTEIFLLEYTDGKAMSDVAWGRLTPQQIQQVTQLHTLDFNLVDRTPYLAQTQGSNLLQHIRATINQAATGTATPDAIGPLYDSVLMLVGHDNQLAAVGGLMNVDWQPATFAQDDTPPGGGFVYELRQNPDSSYIVRLYFINQTMDQMHNATPLTLQSGPSIAPIFVPGASTNTPHFDMPLAAFNAMVTNAINAQYTN